MFIRLKKELNTLIASFVFFTIIPLPVVLTKDNSTDNALRYFPLVGWLTGGMAALVWYLVSEAGLGKNISILSAMIVSTWITGALHEDGLADTFDGLGAGRTRDNILRIMKDSFIGTYGVLSLVFSKAVVFFLYMQVESSEIWKLILIVEPISRWMVHIPVFFLNYARQQSLSKAGPVSINYKKNLISLLLPLIPAAFPGIYFLGVSFYTVFLIPSLSVLLITYYYKKRLNGYTGDMLGAVQQISVIITLYSYIINNHYGVIH